MSSNRLFTSLQILRRTLEKQLSTVLSALRTKVYDIHRRYEWSIVQNQGHGKMDERTKTETYIRKMNTFAIGSLPVHFSVAKLFNFRWQYTGG